MRSYKIISCFIIIILALSFVSCRNNGQVQNPSDNEVSDINPDGGNGGEENEGENPEAPSGGNATEGGNNAADSENTGEDESNTDNNTAENEGNNGESQDDADNSQSGDNNTSNDNNTSGDENDNQGATSPPAEPEYTVTFIVSDTESFTKTTSSKIESFSSPVREHYDFLGWYLDDIEWSFDTSVSSDITLKAKWKAHDYRITYVLNGGENPQTNTAVYSVENEFPTLADAMREDAYFMGWYSDPDFEAPFVYGDNFADVTVYAKFIMGSDGFLFDRALDGYYIKSYSGSDDFVYIPKVHDDLPVIGISAGAFSNTDITGVEIPNTVKYIEAGAFSSCKKLKYNKYLGSSYLGNLDNPFLAFIKNSDDETEELVLHENTKIIADAACRNMGCLISVQGANQLAYVGARAFENCVSLENLDFLKNVIEIGDFAFASCMQIKKITLPSTLVRVGKSSFIYCTKLESANLPDSLTTLPNKCFAYCISLKAIIVGKSVSKVELDAFLQTNDKFKVYYRDNALAWDKIEFEGDFIFNMENLYYYSDTLPEDEALKCWHYREGEIAIW